VHFHHTAIASLEYVLPPEVVSSADLERSLAPLYQRLRLPEGRLELMTGIRERRFWPKGFRPSQGSAEAAAKALAASPAPPSEIGLLIHSAVCRDMLEPATATFVHRTLGLPRSVQVMDVSNACLGFLNAMTLAAGMIESGLIRAALISSGENGRPLLDRTMARLLDGSLDRQGIKPLFANLTIGAGAVAAVLCHESLAPSAPRFTCATAYAATEHSDLCQGDSAGDGLEMQTDSEQLLVAGIDAAHAAWQRFLAESGWTPDCIDRTCCHQVGSTHRRALFQRLSLDPAKDQVTFDRLGNVGSVSCPITLAIAVEEGFIRPGHRVGLLGIGSGVNCLMAGIEWR
jgi:3-oxoacyl-[acyl-carrier-protein] synthase-3